MVNMQELIELAEDFKKVKEENEKLKGRVEHLEDELSTAVEYFAQQILDDYKPTISLELCHYGNELKATLQPIRAVVPRINYAAFADTREIMPLVIKDLAAMLAKELTKMYIQENLRT